MSGVKHTPGPLTVRVSERWPYDIETVNADGDVVFFDRMPAYSTAMRSHEDLWKGVGFPARKREEVVEVNRRAVADATIRAAAPDLLEALGEMEAACERIASERSPQVYGLMIEQGQSGNLLALDEARRASRTAIARARGEQSPIHSDQQEVGNG